MFNYIFVALQKRPEDINARAADMWSFAILLVELETREVPFADLSPMEIGMKVTHRTVKSRYNAMFRVHRNGSCYATHT